VKKEVTWRNTVKNTGTKTPTKAKVEKRSWGCNFGEHLEELGGILGVFSQ